jgi:transcriptional regulator with XRE-family HTH domain
MARGRPTKSPRTHFGERLYRVRTEKGLSQKHVADKLGLTQPAYADWERHTTALKPEQLAALADILDTSVDYLLGRKTGPQRKGGPVGRARRLFEDISKLPRNQQEKIAAVVEAFVAQYSQKKAA